MDTKPPGQGCPNCERLERKVAELTARIEKLEALLESASRSGKRQAAPFRKKKQATPPKQPGRKPGDEHGEHAHPRPIPGR